MTKNLTKNNLIEGYSRGLLRNVDQAHHSAHNPVLTFVHYEMLSMDLIEAANQAKAIAVELKRLEPN